MNPIVGTAVVLVRWPEGGAELARLRSEGIPRLLMVPQGESPPIDPDPKTDWVRMPIADDELRARVHVLELRADIVAEAPLLPGDGRLLFRGNWVVIPPLSEKLMALFIEHFGAVVPADDLLATAWPDATGRREALRVHLTKLRSLVAPLGLGIKGVRDRGYVLHALPKSVLDSSAV